MPCVKFVFADDGIVDNNIRPDLPMFSMVHVPISDERYAIYVIEMDPYSFRLVAEPSKFGYVQFFLDSVDFYSQQLPAQQHMLDKVIRGEIEQTVKFMIYFHINPQDIVIESTNNTTTLTVDGMTHTLAASFTYQGVIVNYSVDNEFHFLVPDERVLVPKEVLTLPR